MKIAIIGPGAIGRLLAWLLVQGGHHPLMICRRDEQAQAFNQHGLTFVDLDGSEQTVPVAAISQHAPNATEQLSQIDAAIITVKSYDTQNAGKWLTTAQVPVLSLQNGLGNGETLSEMLPESLISLALTTHGATADGDTKVLYKGQGQTIIGDWLEGQGSGKNAHWWAEIFESCGHRVTVTDTIRTEVWRKAMINIGINPFTALLRVPNGELLKKPSVLPLMQSAVQEAESVANALGIPLHNSFDRVLEVCKNTATNRSSMLQDIEQNRTTEIDALCGVIQTKASQLNISTPTNATLTQLIQALHP